MTTIPGVSIGCLESPPVHLFDRFTRKTNCGLSPGDVRGALRISDNARPVTCPDCLATHDEAPPLISESERLWIEDKNDPKARRLAAMMVATLLAGSHHTEACVAEDKQIANAVRVALKIIRAVDDAA